MKCLADADADAVDAAAAENKVFDPREWKTEWKKEIFSDDVVKVVVVVAVVSVGFSVVVFFQVAEGSTVGWKFGRMEGWEDMKKVCQKFS